MAGTPDPNDMSWEFTDAPILYSAPSPSIKRTFERFLSDHPEPASIPRRQRTGFNGIQPIHEYNTGANSPSWSKKFTAGVLTFVCITAESTKRRLVSVVRRRSFVSPHRRDTAIFRQTPGRSTSIPITPPRFRPASPYRMPGTYPSSPSQRAALPPSPSPVRGLMTPTAETTSQIGGHEVGTIPGAYPHSPSPLRVSTPLSSPVAAVPYPSQRPIRAVSYPSPSPVTRVATPSPCPRVDPLVLELRALHEKYWVHLPRQVARPTNSYAASLDTSAATASEAQHAHELIEITRSTSSELPSKGHQPHQVTSQTTSDISVATTSEGQHADELIELTRSSPNEFSSEGLQIHQVASATTSGSSSAISSKGQHADESIESTRSSSSKLPSKGHQPHQVASPTTSDSAVSTINKGQHADELIESTRSSPNEFSSEGLQIHQVASATTSGSSSAISSKGQHADELIESTRSSSSKLPSKGHQPQQVASPATSDSAISTINKGQHTDELIESTRSSPNELSSEEQQKYQVASTIDPYVSPPGSFLRMLQEANFGKMSKKKSPLREHHSKANARRPLPKTPKKSVTFLSDPVTRTKKYIVGEKISFPSPISSVDENSILSIAASLHRSSPTQEEQVAMLEAQMRDYSPTNTMSSRLYESIASYDTQDYNRNASTYTTPTTPSPSGPRHYRSHSSPNESMASEQMPETPTEAADSTPTTPTYDSSSLFEEIAFEELNLSGRRSSLRNAQKAEDARKLRLEKAARKAAERARKEKEQAEEQARKKKAEAEEQARKEAAEAEERKKASRRIPVERVVQPLSVEWESKVTAALAKPLNTAEVAQSVTATPISRRDIGRVLPQAGKDPANGWLNDEVINAYLQAVVEYGHQLRGHKRGQTPKLHAFNPFFWSNLNEFGPEKVSRWAKKAKIGEDTLLSVEHVFIPINRGGNHWTLGVVSPTAKTIEYFDSMHNDATRPISMIRAWLACELRGRYRSEEWIVVEDPAHRGVGKGPSQDNLSDCGVFTVTTAKMVSLGVDPMAVSARDMPLQRKRIVAELLNGGFSGGFEPNVVFA